MLCAGAGLSTYFYMLQPISETAAITTLHAVTFDCKCNPYQMLPEVNQLFLQITQLFLQGADTRAAIIELFLQSSHLLTGVLLFALGLQHRTDAAEVKVMLNEMKWTIRYDVKCKAMGKR